MASPITIICFDNGGSYIKDGAEIKWISGAKLKNSDFWKVRNYIKSIWCDEDVLGYLMQVNNKKCKSVLHVEINSDIDDTDGGHQH